MTKPIVLVHGAFHGAWCWRPVVEGLRAAGAQVEAIDLPGHGASEAPMSDLYGDAAAVRQALEALDQPAILCGHSYGGAVISEAVDDPSRVAHLVYLAALVPRAGRTVQADVDELEPDGMGETLQKAMIPLEDGLFRLEPSLAHEVFYHDCRAEDREWAVARLETQRVTNFGQIVTHAPWNEVPSTYVLCEADRAITPSLQEKLATRCSETLRLSAGHFPSISQPERIVEILLSLAAR
jgi:pimeloyl-ACP methyl ester carboxylesterase